MNHRFCFYSLAVLFAVFFSTPVFSAPPVPSFTVTRLNDTLYQFNAVATRDPDEINFVLLNYSWSFSPDPTGNSGDGSYIISRTFQPGSYTATLTVTDRDGEFASTSRNFTVGSAPPPENRAPQAANDFSNTAAGEAVTINVLGNDSDPDGDSFSIESFSQPANGSATISGASIRYQPDDGFSGVDQFSYTIADDEGLTDSAQVSVTVEAPAENQAPVATDDFVETNYQQAISISVLANDSDPDGDSVSLLNHTGPENGTATIADASIRYVPEDGFSGTDSFRYTIQDPDGLTDSARVSVTVGEQLDLKPTASFSYSINQLTVTFDWTGQAGDGATRFKWEFGDGQVSSDENPVHSFATAGTYEVKLTVTDEDGDDEVSARSVTVTDEDSPLIAPDFTVAPDSTDPLKQLFTFSSTGNADDLLFRWSFGDDSAESNEQNPEHQYTLPGKYLVQLTISNSKGESLSVEKQITVSSGEVSPDDEVAAIIFTKDFKVEEGRTATLAGSGFRQAQQSGEVRWRQIPVAGSPTVALSSDDEEIITFVAPVIDVLSGEGPEIELIFEMQAIFLADPADPNSSLLTDTAEVVVTVEDNGITAIPADYISSHAEVDETPFGIKTSQGDLYLMESFSLKEADKLNTTNRPRRAPLGLLDLELHANGNGQAVIEFRLLEALPNDYVWYSHSDEAGWEVFPEENSGDSIVIDGDTVTMTLNDVVQVAPRASGDRDTSDGIIRLRTGPGQVSTPTEVNAAVASGSISLFMLVIFGLLQVSRRFGRYS